MTRAIRFIVHNWPLKVAAIALATLLYGGLVVSQAAQPFNSPVPIDISNAPADVIVLSNPGSVTRISYVAPPDLGLRIDSTTFEAFVDLGDVEPAGGSVSLDVTVRAVDPRVQVLDFEPRAIVLSVDRVGSRTVPIRAVVGVIPSGLDVGEPIVEGSSATVRGPQSIVSGISEVQAQVSIDSSGIDVDQLVNLVAIDGSGAALGPLTRIEIEPARVRVQIPVFTDRRSKTLPVSPNVVGTPAAGFEVISVAVDPPVVSVEGDANDLAGLDRADTDPITVSGASSQVVQVVGLVLPDGVQALGAGTVQVTVRLRPITATRTFEAGLILVGARADLRYSLSTDRVVVTIGGSVADLDRLAATLFVLTVDVTGLEAGTHAVPVSANLTTGLTLVGASPNPVEVSVSTPASSPAPTAGPSAAP
jgi:YbbR domain-containing protein